MKATTTIIAAVLALQVNTLSAGNDFPPMIAGIDANASYCVSRMPYTPAEAMFEDEVTVNMKDLVPVTPAEASFEEMTPEIESAMNLSPLTPEAADFDDEIVPASGDVAIPAPVAPAEADFE